MLPYRMAGDFRVHDLTERTRLAFVPSPTYKVQQVSPQPATCQDEPFLGTILEKASFQLRAPDGVVEG